MQPEYIFETSWEVCNRVGGIYAVLSTRAASMQAQHKNKVIFFGPDLDTIYSCHTNEPFFTETPSLLPAWQKQAVKQGLKFRIGRWEIPGRPIAILVDFRELYAEKDAIYAKMWTMYQVKSHAAYGDYDESCLFSYYVGMVMESLYNYITKKDKNIPVCAHFNEWQTAFGEFYVKERCPKIGTLFTTHATGIGRSIAGNGKPLYDYFEGYNGDQMADELNMVSKHSVEKQAAHHADCFTTVSDITAKECKQLLDKPVDIVTPNGFELDFVPQGKAFDEKRQHARAELKRVAEAVLHQELAEDTLYICTSGRYEWKNKGIDAYLEAVRRLMDKPLKQTVVAYILVPGWQSGAKTNLGKDNPWTTHTLCDPDHDPAILRICHLGLWNRVSEKVKVIFVPSYLNGNDGIFDMPYYDLLIGMDASVFPSYYEPWGYTPMESTAFRVPTITTCLSGFGQWVADWHLTDADTGVHVCPRTDSNWEELINDLRDTLYAWLTASPTDKASLRQAAMRTSEKVTWKQFFAYYEQAYEIALKGKVEG